MSFFLAAHTHLSLWSINTFFCVPDSIAYGTLLAGFFYEEQFQPTPANRKPVLVDIRVVIVAKLSMVIMEAIITMIMACLP